MPAKRYENILINGAKINPNIENPVKDPNNIMPIRIKGPNLSMFRYHPSDSRGTSPRRICEPSRGGIGIILKTARIIFN